jgi:hypothetical protein
VVEELSIETAQPSEGVAANRDIVRDERRPVEWGPTLGKQLLQLLLPGAKARVATLLGVR